MNYCSFCGNQVSEKSMYCSKCGKEVNKGAIQTFDDAILSKNTILNITGKDNVVILGLKDNSEILTANVDKSIRVFKHRKQSEKTARRETPYNIGKFEEIINEYNLIAEEGQKTSGRASNYRRIFIDGWPKKMHYEFIDYPHKGIVGVELHLEDQSLKGLFRSLGEVVPGLRSNIDSNDIQDMEWRGNRKIQIRMSNNLSPEEIAGSMKRFIQLTKEGFSKKLNAMKD